MAGTETSMGLDQGMVDACGLEPGYACEWIWDTTGNEVLASLVNWLIERPLKVVVILIGALMMNWVDVEAGKKDARAEDARNRGIV